MRIIYDYVYTKNSSKQLQFLYLAIVKDFYMHVIHF